MEMPRIKIHFYSETNISVDLAYPLSRVPYFTAVYCATMSDIRQSTSILHSRVKHTTLCPSKNVDVLLFNNSPKNQPILIICGTHNSE